MASPPQLMPEQTYTAKAVRYYIKEPRAGLPLVLSIELHELVFGVKSVWLSKLKSHSAPTCPFKKKKKKKKTTHKDRKSKKKKCEKKGERDEVSWLLSMKIVKHKPKLVSKEIVKSTWYDFDWDVVFCHSSQSH